MKVFGCHYATMSPPAIVERRPPQTHAEFMALMREAVRHMDVINQHLRRINGRDNDTQGG